MNSKSNSSGVKPIGKRSIWAMIIIFMLPLIIALVLYNLRDHWDVTTTNYGAFINPPLDIGDLHAQRTSTHAAVNADSYRGKWLLVYVDDGLDTKNSDLSLRKLESIYYSLGRDVSNVRPLFIAKTPPSDEAKGTFAREHRFIRTASADLSRLGALPGHFYVVDPQGKLILSYEQNAQSNGILRDLRKLLKVGNG